RRGPASCARSVMAGPPTSGMAVRDDPARLASRPGDTARPSPPKGAFDDDSPLRRPGPGRPHRRRPRPPRPCPGRDDPDLLLQRAVRVRLLQLLRSGHGFIFLCLRIGELQNGPPEGDYDDATLRLLRLCEV